MTKHGTFAIYKKKGAAKFTLLPPRWAPEDKYVEKEGAVLLEAAPGVGDQKWDWQSKINFAISVQDVCNLLDDEEKKHRLFHDHGGEIKTLEFKPGDGGSFMMYLTQGKAEAKQTIVVPISSGEWQVFIRVLINACSKMLAW